MPEPLLKHYPEPWRTTVAISIGNSMDFAIKEGCPDKRAELVLQHSDGVVCLGPFTRDRIRALKSYLTRLEIHAGD